MNRVKQLILSAVCVCVIFSGITVRAEDTLPEAFLIGDQDGLTVSYEGEYFIDALNIKPGDVIERKLTLRNVDSENDLPYVLSMTSEPMGTTGPVDLLTELNLEMKLDGTVIYTGRLRGDEGQNMIENALQLGEYGPGDTRILDVKLTASNNFEIIKGEPNSEASIGWKFYAVRMKDEAPPKTGEIVQYVLYAVILSNMLTISMILLFKKKKEERMEAMERGSGKGNSV